MSSRVFEKVLEFLYTGRGFKRQYPHVVEQVQEMPLDICIEVLEASNMLGLPRLNQLCESAILPLVDKKNVFQYNYLNFLTRSVGYSL
jgi:hypothetical protein